MLAWVLAVDYNVMLKYNKTFVNIYLAYSLIIYNLIIYKTTRSLNMINKKNVLIYVLRFIKTLIFWWNVRIGVLINLRLLATFIKPKATFINYA